MIELLPTAGRTLRDLHQTLQKVMEESQNTTSASGAQGIAEYAQWARRGSEQLDATLTGFHGSELIYTPHYLSLFALDGSVATTQLNAVRATLRIELQRLIDEAEKRIGWWHDRRCVVVLDTNMLVQTNVFFDAIDWPAGLGVSDSVNLVVPMAVVDELDSLKRDSKARTRARGVLRLLEERLAAPYQRSALPNLGQDHNLATTIEVLGDPLDHHRLPDVDSEIVSRATYLRDMRMGKVSFATWDGGARFRATGEDLRVLALPRELQSD